MHIAELLLLALIVVLSVSLAEVYRGVPLYELKRRARDGNELAKALYPVATHGLMAQVVLWFIGSLSAAFFFVLIDQKAPLWVAFMSSLALLWLGYIWLPQSQFVFFADRIAIWLSPYYSKLLNGIHPIGRKLTEKTRSDSPHTGIYEQADVIDFLERQEKQLDNRLTENELLLLKGVIHFSALKAGDILIPTNKVNLISINEVLSPVVLGELHKKGHSIYGVYDRQPENIVGFINVSSIPLSKSSPKVADVMSDHLAYAHEDQTLTELLSAIINNQYELFVVVDGDGKTLGVLPFSRVISVIGNKIKTEGFNSYENKTEVANRFVFFDDKPETEDQTEVIE